jgi:hypothetical protein
MAHLALHFPVVKRKTDSSFRLELRELKELPERLFFIFASAPYKIEMGIFKIG